MPENLHASAVPPDVLAEVRQKLADAYNLLKPFLVSITPTKRRTLYKVGEKSWGFLERTHGFSKQYPHLLPAFLDTGAFDIDFADARNLRAIKHQALLLSSSLDDTLMVASSEALQSALVIYKSAKVAAAQNIPGGKLVYAELKNRFSRPARRKPAADVEPDAGEV
jgi:hypothetical protein